MRKMRNAYKIIVKKHEGKGPFVKSRSRKKGNIKMYLSQTGCNDMYWIHMAQKRQQWWAFVMIAMKFGFYNTYGM